MQDRKLEQIEGINNIEELAQAKQEFGAVIKEDLNIETKYTSRRTTSGKLLTAEEEKELAQEIEKKKHQIVDAFPIWRKAEIENIIDGWIDEAVDKNKRGYRNQWKKRQEIKRALLNFMEGTAQEKDILDIPIVLLHNIAQALNYQYSIELVDETRYLIDEFALQNLGLVFSEVRKYDVTFLPVLDFEDLFEAGFEGLYKAIEKFDWRKSYRFSTLAKWWIQQAIKKTIEKNKSPIRVPQWQRLNQKKLNAKKAKFRELYNRSPTHKELAIFSGFGEQKIKQVESLPETVISLDQETFPEGSGTQRRPWRERQEVATPDFENEVIQKLAREEIREIIEARLSPREKDIIFSRFGFDGKEPQTLSKVGTKLGITRQRVRQIEKKALEKLKKGLIGIGLE